MNEEPQTQSQVPEYQPERLNQQLSIPPKKSRKGLKLLTLFILILVALSAIGYAIYAWQQNQNLSAAISSKDNEIEKLKKSSEPAESAFMPVDIAIVPIRELGISITAPESLNDLTFSYSTLKGSNYDAQVVYFSTKTLTDKDQECSSHNSAPPLGLLARVEGQFPTTLNVDTAPGPLVKQFANFYIASRAPQATCTDDVQLSTDSQNAFTSFKKTFSSIKEL